MKKVALSLAAIALVSFSAGEASALCDFNIGKDAKGGKWDLVRAYATCGGSTEFPAANDVTNTGTPSCSTPAVATNGAGPATDWQFNEKGKCALQIQGKIDDACEEMTDNNKNPLGLPAGACSYLDISVKCGGIVANDGVTGVENGDSVWRLQTNTRATLADQGGTDMTVIDFTLPIEIDPSNVKKHKIGGGKLAVKTNSAIELASFLSPEAAALPPCANFEIVDIVLEADNQPFARMGSAVKDVELLP